MLERFPPSRRILFVKHNLAHPRASGHDVVCFEMLRAFQRLGNFVALATVEPTKPESREQLDIDYFSLADQHPDSDPPSPPLDYLQERFRRYWGIRHTTIRAVSRVATEVDANVVVGLGLDVLPYLAGAGDRVKVWYAADEWVIHHLSQFRPSSGETYAELRHAAIKGLYERVYRKSFDRAWVVSPSERRAMRRIAGVRNVDVIPNGVDTEYFSPTGATAAGNSAVFWGRLDFGPNIQSLDWFCNRIWPEVRRRVPTAALTIMGFHAVPHVRSLADAPGIQLVTDVADIRGIVEANQLAILPIVSGGGIKNKLLEAAAMGKAIICTSRACGGLRSTPPAIIANDEKQWIDALLRAWESDEQRRQLERAARVWVLEHHSWEAAARDALEGLDLSLKERRPAPSSARRATTVDSGAANPPAIQAVAKAAAPPRRILFVKHSLAYPRASGHDIRCFEMLRAFHQLGNFVALATIVPTGSETRQQLDIHYFSLNGHAEGPALSAQPLTYWQERFRSYWGIPDSTIQAVARIGAEIDAGVVVGLGLDVLPLLAGAGDRVKVWYAADEWIVHHLSQFTVGNLRSYGELRHAAIKGLYERAYAGSLDRAWVVSPSEQHAMRRYAGVAHVDVIPNGVDTDYFAPSDATPADNSAVFWGRLDFGPNIQSIDWFCDRIWPELRRRVPTASLTIMGFNAVPEVRARANAPGIRVVTDVPDIRPIVAAHKLAILPMVSGGGIKNKLLEAAALGKAIICTSRSCGGLRSTPPAIIADDEAQWVEAMVRAWQSDDDRRKLERQARGWILEHHTWEAAARDGLRGLDQSLGERGHRRRNQ